MVLINAKNLAHDSGLVHACVVMLAALAREMAGICDIYMYLVRSYLCIMKFGLSSQQ